jgi:translocation and assembly module TamB
VRDIYGNTQIQTAGVMISGTAERPLIEAYTYPLTTRERAWALLITGQDFEYGQGVGAFDIGTYIAPRLYISYGVSLFDDANVVSARYDLRRGFGVKATSSQTENGLDISYTLTRGRTGKDQPEPGTAPPDSDGDAP